ncbi:MAG: DUF4304 domain-containing protein [Alphaproteobacteria bacterium]
MIKKNNFLRERLTNIVKKSIQNSLNTNGFLKKGLTFEKKTQELIYQLKIRISPGKIGELWFCIDFDIVVPPGVSWGFPTNFDIALGGWITHIDPTYKDKTWIILKETDQEWEQQDQVAIEWIRKLLTETVLPFFQNIRTLKDVITVLENEPDSPYEYRFSIPCHGGQAKQWLAYLYYIIGKKEHAIKILDGQIEFFKSPIDKIIKKDLEQLRQQMFFGMNEKTK